MSTTTSDESTPSPLDQIGSWCRLMPGATVDTTFGPETDVHRVGDKIFAMVNTDDPGYVTIKAPPDEIIALLDQYDCARPGYYMHKRHWITFDVSDSIPMTELPELIANSHRLVLTSLPKKRQAEILTP